DDDRGAYKRSNLVFVFQPLEVLRTAAARVEDLQDNGFEIGLPDRAEEDGAAALVESLRDRVRKRGCHGEGPRRAKRSIRSAGVLLCSRPSTSSGGMGSPALISRLRSTIGLWQPRLARQEVARGCRRLRRGDGQVPRTA